MSILMLNALNELVFAYVKDQQQNKERKSVADKTQINDSLYNQFAEKNKTVKCSCCGWSGKGSEARKNILFLEHLAEMELFCLNCNSYLGYIPIKPDGNI